MTGHAVLHTLRLTLHLNTEGLQHSSPSVCDGALRETEVPLAPTASCMASLRLGSGSLASVDQTSGGVRVSLGGKGASAAQRHGARRLFRNRGRVRIQ